MSKEEVPLFIADVPIYKGEEKRINAHIARLPSHTPIEIPILVYRAKEEGPTLLLMGGLHGDEINGMEIVRQLMDKGHHRVQRGTVICIPILNVFGFINFSREVPDGKDVNRSFPGNKNGSLASRVAYYLMKEIIPKIDYGIDFHTGGAARANYPQIRAVLKHTVNRDLAKAFAPPLIINAPLRAKSLRQAAFKLGKPIIVYEGGESLRFDENAIHMGAEGALRVMHFLGMIDTAPLNTSPTEVLQHTSWVRARFAGLFRAVVDCGDTVAKNQLLGTITNPFGEFTAHVKASQGGIIIGINHLPVVHQGDAIVHIGLLEQYREP